MGETISQRAQRVMGPKPAKPEEVCPTCRQKVPHPRNRQRHNLLFAFLPAAVQHWPDTHEFQPKDAEDLRYYLLNAAGHCDYDHMKLDSTDPKALAAAMQSFMNRHRDKKGVHYRVGGLTMKAFIPKSISFNLCKEEVFGEVLQKCIDIVEVVIGVSIEQLKYERKREM
jgi:hypothetical protein